MKNLKLSTKLIGGDLLAVVVPMLIVGIISINASSKALVQTGKDKTGKVAADLVIAAEMFLSEESNLVMPLSRTPLVANVEKMVGTVGENNAIDALKRLYQDIGQVLSDSKEIHDFFSYKQQGNCYFRQPGGKAQTSWV